MAGMPPTASSGPTLSQALGLTGRNYLVQHKALSLGHSYRVMDASKKHLFTVQGDAAQNITGNLLGNLAGGGYIGRLAARSVNMTYGIVAADGTRWGQLAKTGGGNQSMFTLTDNAGQPWVIIQMERGLMGGVKATAVWPNGQPMMQTSGNLLRHNFMIRDGAGADLAKVHEQWVSIRDTYNVDIMGNIDPLFPLVYAVVIDYEKEK